VQELNKAPYTVHVRGNITSCNLPEKLRPKVKEILDNIPSIVKENHKRHMEEQAKKSDIGDLKVPEAKGECIVM
jgi:hypothetical protein